jgi:hypothetical protein
MFRFLSVVLPLSVVVAVVYLTWALWPNSSAISQVTFDPDVDSAVLTDLGPGTTLHTVTVIYRRYGPEDSGVPRRTLPPEKAKNETWISFDATGAMASYLGEVRDMDGTLYASARLEGDDLVSRNPDGTERLSEHVRGFRQSMTVDSAKASLRAAYMATFGAVAGKGDAGTTEINSTPVLVVETSHLSASTPQPVLSTSAQQTGYKIPYVADLDLTEIIQRSYVLPNEYRSARSETVVMSEDGTETVVESRDYTVLEAIPDAAAQ